MKDIELILVPKIKQVIVAPVNPTIASIMAQYTRTPCGHSSWRHADRS